MTVAIIQNYAIQLKFTKAFFIFKFNRFSTTKINNRLSSHY